MTTTYTQKEVPHVLLSQPELDLSTRLKLGLDTFRSILYRGRRSTLS
jgi:hypothetical protein